MKTDRSAAVKADVKRTEAITRRVSAIIQEVHRTQDAVERNR